MTAREIIERVKRKLTETYGDQLVEVVVYGSEARGDAAEDSDLDLLIVLRKDLEDAGGLRELIDAVYLVQMESGFFRPIHVVPVSEDEFRARKFALYRNAAAEGLSV